MKVGKGCVCSGGERQKIWIDSGLVIDQLKKGTVTAG
jgi:hypothetical protein